MRFEFRDTYPCLIQVEEPQFYSFLLRDFLLLALLVARAANSLTILFLFTLHFRSECCIVYVLVRPTTTIHQKGQRFEGNLMVNGCLWTPMRFYVSRKNCIYSCDKFQKFEKLMVLPELKICFVVTRHVVDQCNLWVSSSSMKKVQQSHVGLVKKVKVKFVFVRVFYEANLVQFRQHSTILA